MASESNEETAEAVDALALVQRFQDQMIANRLPDWVGKVAPGDYGLLNEALRMGLVCRQRLARVWAQVEPIDQFATTRLQQALAAQQDLSDDVSQLYFRQWYDYQSPSVSYFTTRVPIRESDYYDQPLLAAALANFTDEQTRASGQRRGNAVVDVAGRMLTQPSATAFAKFCRELDLGGQYQRHLDRLLDGPGDAANGGKTFKALLADLQRAGMLVDAFRARAEGQLDSAELECVIALYRNGKPGRLGDAPVVAKQLQVFDCELQQIVVLDVVDEGIIRDTSKRVLVYIPGDPNGAWSVAPDLETFARRGLGKRLRDADYRRFFSRFVLQRDCGRFFAAVLDQVGDVADWATRELDQHMKAYPLPLFEHLGARRIAQIKDDASVIAMPVAKLDRAVQVEHERFLENLGWTVVGLVGLFIPAVGAMMLAVMAWDLLKEVFQSVEDWREGDTNAALDHLVNVGKDVAVLATTAAGIKVAQTAWQRSVAVDSMVPAVLKDGSSKLWNQDLTPYTVARPPAAAVVDAQGVHRLGEQSWIEMEGHYFRVFEEGEGYWYLHTHRDHAPLLEHNGAGAWRLWSERPAEWRGTQRMFRRLGGAFGELDDMQIERVLMAHGMDADHLRGLHVYARAPDAELVDTVSRVRLANRLRGLVEQLRSGVEVQDQDLLESVTARLDVPGDPGAALAESIWTQRRSLLQALYDEQNVVEGDVALLCRDFTSLHRLSALRLLEEASAAEREALHASGRVPLSLASRARARVRRIQVARVAEGLFIDTPQTFAFARVVLRLLDTLHGAPAGRRWSLVDGDGQVPMYDSGGAGPRMTLTHQEGVFVLDGGQGIEPSAPGELFEVLADAYSAPQLAAMGVAEPVAANLRLALARQMAGRRVELAQWLGPDPAGERRLPMRLEDGRIGYPLSGGRRRLPYNAPRSLIARLRHLYPAYSDDRLEQWLDSPEVARDANGVLDDLEGEYEALRQALRQWRRNGIATLEWDARGHAKRALVDCWRFTLPALDAQAREQGVLFALEDLDIRSLPRLPASVKFPHINVLILRGLKIDKVPDEFLLAFPNMDTLEITNCKLNQLTLPQPLRSALRVLDLTDNRLVLHREQAEMLAECGELRYLNLSRNPLGMSFSLRDMPHLSSLLLRKTQLRNFPIGVLDCPRLNHLDMSDNSLLRLPEGLAASRLWREGRVRLVNANVALPATLPRAWYEPENSPVPVRLRWQDHIRPKFRKDLANLWRTLEAKPGSESFFRLLARLSRSADFGSDSTASFLASRLLDLCEVLAEEGNEALRDELFAAAETENCADNATLCFSNLEVRVRVWEAQQQDLAYDTEHALLRLGGQLWRLDALDTFALRHAAELPNRGAEAVEVVLAFRQALIDDLDLPLNRSAMLYERIADVADGDVVRAKIHVKDRQTSSTLALSMVQRRFWVEFMERMYPSKLKVPKSFRNRLAALEAAQASEQAYQALQAEVERWTLEKRLEITLDGLARATWGWKVQVKFE